LYIIIGDKSAGADSLGVAGENIDFRAAVGTGFGFKLYVSPYASGPGTAVSHSVLLVSYIKYTTLRQIRLLYLQQKGKSLI
jgi:hypothetical protein